MPDHVRADDLLERLIVFVLAASACGLALALAGLFTAPLALVLATLATWAYGRAFPFGREDGPSPLRWQHVLPVLLVALALRLLPFPQVQGGQDQGVYTNMAAELIRSHDLAVTDPAYDRIAAVGELDTYVAENHTDPFLPGVYTLPGEKPRFEFQFYHLFPVWLALFGGLFGAGAMFHALTFLALVSVLFFQRLALLLTGSQRVGIAAGLLLAVNPLHAFFSRFPVTEVQTLAFSLAGFTFLGLYAGSEEHARRRRWLWLSAFCFAGLFLTRISGFMYLPVLLAIPLAAHLADRDRLRARALAGWALATIALYGASVVYGLTWSRSYSLKVYELSFSMLAGSHWPLAVLAGVALVAFASALVWRLPWQSSAALRARRLLTAGEGLLGVALLGVLALGAIKVYRLAFTDAYAGDQWLASFPGVAGSGWSSVAHSSLFVVAVYLCPLLFAAFLVLAQRRWPAPAARLLLLFLLCFLAYAALLNWTVVYQPYYARYFVSELVPYTLLFTACCLAWLGPGRARRALAVVLALSALYGFALSVAQSGKRENAGALESIGRVAQFADEGDAILLDNSPGQGFEHNEIKTTLAHTFGRQVISIGPASLRDAGYLSALDRAFDDLLLVSAAATQPPGFVRVDGVRLRAMGFPRSAHPPVSLVPTLDASVNVFRLERSGLAPGGQQHFRADDPSVFTQVGRLEPARGLVSDGRAGFLMFGPYVSVPAGDYRLQVSGTLAGRWAGGPAVFDVVTQKGQVQLAQATARPSPEQSDGIILTLDFSVPEPGATDLEVRAQVPEAADAAIRDYLITRLR